MCVCPHSVFPTGLRFNEYAYYTVYPAIGPTWLGSEECRASMHHGIMWKVWTTGMVLEWQGHGPGGEHGDICRVSARVIWTKDQQSQHQHWRYWSALSIQYSSSEIKRLACSLGRVARSHAPFPGNLPGKFRRGFHVLFDHAVPQCYCLVAT